MTKTQLTLNYQQDKVQVQNNPKFTQAEKDVILFKRWRVYVDAHSLASIKQEAAEIEINHLN
jgi:hypothetical protein